MIEIGWSTYQDTTATAFNVYRAITGFSFAASNSLVIGDTLTFSATSPTAQNITFSAVDHASVISIFNAQALGAVATLSHDSTKVLIRATASPTKAKFKLYPCTFATHLSAAPRTIVPGLEFAEIATVTFIPSTFTYSYDDLDGTNLDAYEITSVVGATESIPSVVQYPQIGTALLCAIFGRCADSQNRPVTGLLIKARPRLYETSVSGQYVDEVPTTAYTDAYGRFIIYLPRGETYLLQIPDVGYNETVCVPNLASAGIVDLIPTLAGRFAPFEDPN